MNGLHRIGVAGIAIADLLLVACSGTPINTSYATQRGAGEGLDTTRGRQISASASGFSLFQVIPISINSRQARAFEALKSQASGDYVTNITIDESWTYAFIGTVHTTTLAATAYPRTAAGQTPRSAQQPGPGAATPAASVSQMCDLPSLVDKAECLGRLRLGMSKPLVTNLLGPPTETLGNGSVLRYDDRYLKFDSRDLLIGITDARPQ